MNPVLQAITEATAGSIYEGHLYLVGGFVRDELLGIESSEDVDIVLEGSAKEFVDFLFARGIAENKPVVYARFGTAMITIADRQVEVVGARSESYLPNSRKPTTIPGTLADDIHRRDFTINCLLKNLCTGEILDLTGKGIADLRAGVIKTPLEPQVTFADDPLRMLRAVRFAARFGFTLEPATYAALSLSAKRLDIVSKERVREEFVKIISGPRISGALEVLRDTGLLTRFLPEMVECYGVTQNDYHLYDVWAHSLLTLSSLPNGSSVTLRLAALFHDIGKPPTKTVDKEGKTHFYGHQKLGEVMTRAAMHRLKFSNAEIDEVAFMVAEHMRVGAYDAKWSNSAVRRLAREIGDRMEDMVELTRADVAASNPEMPSVDLPALAVHIHLAMKEIGGSFHSILNGHDIMELANCSSGPIIGEAKQFIEDQVIEGHLRADDRESAIALAREFISSHSV